MGIFVRGQRLWARFKDSSGAWVNKRTPYEVGQETDAERYLARRVANAAATRDADERAGRPGGGPLTVREFAARWLKERRGLGVRSIADDESRMNRHVLPRLGDLDIGQIRPAHVREFVITLRTATARKDSKLAPRTIRNVYGLLSTMFRDAVAEGLITSTPCVLRKGVLPPKVDKDPTWRETAIYTRGEVERLISERLIPEDRRVLYALKGLAGLRHGEAASLRWRQYDARLEPLGGLALEVTKTGVPRRVPVHPPSPASWPNGSWRAGSAPTAVSRRTRISSSPRGMARSARARRRRKPSGSTWTL
jgi:integrase